MGYLAYCVVTLLAGCVPLFVGSSKGKGGAAALWFGGCLGAAATFYFLAQAGVFPSAFAGLATGAVACVVMSAVGVGQVSKPGPHRTPRRKRKASTSGRVPRKRKRR